MQELLKDDNTMEFYGRIPHSNKANEDGGGHLAFLTVLMNYEQATETIRLHFNMKEPGH